MKRLIILLVSTLMAHTTAAQTLRTNITVLSDDLGSSDTLELYVWKDLLGKPFSAPYQAIRMVSDHGVCGFQINDLQEISWVSLYFSYQKAKGIPLHGIFHLLPICAGDDVVVRLTPKQGKFEPIGGGYDGGEPIYKDNWQVDFLKGQGKEIKKISVELTKFLESQILQVEVQANNQLGYIDTLEDIYSECIAYLDTKRAKLTDGDYRLLRYEVLGKIGVTKIKHLKRTLAFAEDRALLSKEVLEVLEKLVQGMLSVGNTNTDLVYAYPSLIQYWSDLISFYTYLASGSKDLRRPVDWIIENLVDKNIQDRVLTGLLLQHFSQQPSSEILGLVIDSVEDMYALQRLDSLKTLVKDAVALTFGLPDANDRIHRLSDYRGKIILIDFWYMGCIPCRKYIDNVIKPLSEQVRGQNNVEIILVSLDDKNTLSQAMASGIIPSSVVSLYTDGLKFRHPLIRELGINSFPYPLLVNEEGIVRASGHQLKTMDQILEEINKLY